MITESDFDPAHLLELKRQAAEEGISLEAVVTRTIERGLALELQNIAERKMARGES
jgi:hypothetical protein